jgi:3-oxoacyl-[acyl-carrier protein] reductase
MRLADQVAIITGGSRGIGRATAMCLAHEGAKIVIASRDETRAKNAAAAIEAVGGRAIAVPTDVTERDQVENMVRCTMDTFGRIDILVNNAGISISTPLPKVPPEEWDQTIRVHLYGAFYCTQAAVHRMVPRGYGRIVNISSVSGLVGSTGRTAYAAAKGGLIAMTKVWAVELAPQGIRVNAIAPGPVETDMSRNAMTPADREGYHQRVPLARMAQPEEIARVVSFLCLPENDYITGQVLAVDGGFSIAGIQWR